MLNTSTAHVPQNLRDMLIGQSLAGLSLRDQAFLNYQIGLIISENSAVLVEDLYRLLLDTQTEFSQSMNQGILINLLPKPVSVITVNREARFPNHIA